MNVSWKEQVSELRAAGCFYGWFIAITTQLLKTHDLKKSATEQEAHRRILKYLVFCAFYLMVTRKTPERLKLT